jgi:hypothetical protein
MDLACALVDAAPSLAAVHVGGRRPGERHALLHRAANRAAVASFLADLAPSVPLVVEGRSSARPRSCGRSSGSRRSARGGETPVPSGVSP